MLVAPEDIQQGIIQVVERGDLKRLKALENEYPQAFKALGGGKPKATS